MKRYGVISYNIYCNFTNYGSALQSWALHQAIKKLGNYEPILVDYCPDVLADMDPLNPFKNMWDKDEESKRMCELTMPSIRENYFKFNEFYNNRFNKSKKKYTSLNFNDVIFDENIDGFVCGSDTIFCPDEFGIDDGYYANYDCMKNRSVAYAASFGDPTLSKENCKKIDECLHNFNAIGLRENLMIPYVKKHVEVPVEKVIDPTLLLEAYEYDDIIAEPLEKEKYLLLYSRRYSAEMEDYAEKIAKENGWKIVEISLRAINAEKGHKMCYEAGVEEFLSLVKNAEYVVTNSFHGMIFSVQFEREFVIFTREQCDTKVTELLEMLGLSERKLCSSQFLNMDTIDFVKVKSRIAETRKTSLEFLGRELAEFI